jgi:hypothetical protein
VSVERDDSVASWRVNGEKVCPAIIRAAPGCYVLEVEYGISYTKYHPDKSGIGLASPVAGVIEQAAQTTHREYGSGPVPFALNVRKHASYYVTSTFTGDDFLPRIVETDGTGARLQHIDPASSQQALDACRTGATQSPKSSGAHGRSRLAWKLSESTEAPRCE